MTNFNFDLVSEDLAVVRFDKSKKHSELLPDAQMVDYGNGGNILKIFGDIPNAVIYTVFDSLKALYGAIAIYDYSESKYFVVYSNNPDYTIGDYLDTKGFSVCRLFKDEISSVIDIEDYEDAIKFIERNEPSNPEAPHYIIPF